MAGDPGIEFLEGLTPAAGGVAERLILIVSSHTAFDAAIKWRQLTFAVDGHFDHWLCAVAAKSRQTRLTLHFGALLDDPADSSRQRATTSAESAIARRATSMKAWCATC